MDRRPPISSPLYSSAASDVYKRQLDRGIDVRQVTIDQVMTVHGKTVRAEILAAEALKIMEDNKIGALVVVDADDRPVGALNMHDLLRAGVM